MARLTVLEAAWLQAAVVLPLLFHTLSFRVFEPEKTAVLRLLALATLAGILASLAVARTRGGLAVDRLRAPACLVAATLVASACLSTALSLDPWQSLFGSYHRQGGLLTLASQVVLFASVVVGLRAWDQVDRLLSAVTLTGVAVAAYAILQRSGFDPLQWDTSAWAGDARLRTPGSLGNPTFVAGYLAMTCCVTLARNRGAAGLALLALQAGGLWAAASRGGLVALAAGALTFAAAYAAATRARRLAATMFVAGLAGTSALVALNIPDGPLAQIRDRGPWRTVAHVLDTTDETARVRVLLWTSAAALMTRAAPIETVGGQPDRHHDVRPLAGYGPETLPLTISREYPAELARLERPDAVLDRSHNDIVDAWASGGAVGAALTALLYVAVLWTSCRALGLGRRAAIACAGVAVGGLLVAAAAAVLAGRPWLAVPAAGIGALAGFGAALLALGLRSGARLQPGPATVPIAALMAAMIAHCVDAQVGVTTVALRTTFWLLAGIVVAASTGAPLAARSSSGSESPAWLPWMPAGTFAFTFAPAMITASSALTGAVALATLTVPVVAAALAMSLLRPRQIARGIAAVTLLTALFVGLVSYAATGAPDNRDVVSRVAALGAPFVVYLALILAVLVMSRAAWQAGQRHVTVSAVIAAAIGGSAVFLPVRADVLVRSGRQLEGRGYPAAAIPLYEAASRLIPYEVQYRIAAAGGAQLAAAQQADPRVRDLLFERAAALLATDLSQETDLQRAFASARLYHAWAAVSADVTDRVRRAAQANAFYDRLTTLSPGNPVYLNDWASLALDVTRNVSLARTRLERSRALDPQRPDTLRLIAEATRRAASGP
jgi:hypothetical protein